MQTYFFYTFDRNNSAHRMILSIFISAPWKGRETFFFFLLSVTILFWLYNLITVRDISRILHALSKYIQTTCHAQESSILHVYFSNNSPCNINIILCPLYKLNTVKGIWFKRHTLLEHNEAMSHAQETITLLWIFLELFPFDHLQCYFVSTLT